MCLGGHNSVMELYFKDVCCYPTVTTSTRLHSFILSGVKL